MLTSSPNNRCDHIYPPLWVGMDYHTYFKPN